MSPYVQPIFGFLLSCLLILHVYWQYLMIGILLTYAKKGVAEDTVNDLKKKPEEELKILSSGSKKKRKNE